MIVFQLLPAYSLHKQSTDRVIIIAVSFQVSLHYMVAIGTG